MVLKTVCTGTAGKHLSQSSFKKESKDVFDSIDISPSLAVNH